MKTHPNAKLTPSGRELLVRRIEHEGWGTPEAAEAAGVSRRTAYKWLARYRAEGVAGLHDRSSRPHVSPSQMPASTRRRIECAFMKLRGQAEIGQGQTIAKQEAVALQMRFEKFDQATEPGLDDGCGFGR